MNKKNVTIAGLAAALTLGATMAFTTVSAQTGPGPGRMNAMGAQRERHPEIRRAIRTLDRTRMDLMRANRDFGGHRAKAAELVNEAIGELKLALTADAH